MKKTKVHLVLGPLEQDKNVVSCCGLVWLWSDERTGLSKNIGDVTCKNCIKAAGFTFKRHPWENDTSRVSFIAHYRDLVIGHATLVKAVNGFCAFITDVGVLPEYRNKGIATKLIREILAFQPPPIQVNVRAYDGPDNVPHMSDEQLHKFYAKFGFVEFTPSNRNMILLPKSDEAT